MCYIQRHYDMLLLMLVSCHVVDIQTPTRKLYNFEHAKLLNGVTYATQFFASVKTSHMNFIILLNFIFILILFSFVLVVVFISFLIIFIYYSKTHNVETPGKGLLCGVVQWDKATCHVSGTVNCHTVRIWGHEKPPAVLSCPGPLCQSELQASTKFFHRSLIDGLHSGVLGIWL
jgi:hypothetical protein